DRWHRQPRARRDSRLPCEEVDLDRRRRRLGLRHRLRRTRSRAGERREREHPGARYRGLLQHRRPAVEIHADRRRGEVRGCRQARRQEGPRADGNGLRPRVCGAGRVRREGRADAQGVHRGRSVSRAVADHRLQPLHRPRLRHGCRPRPPEARRRQRLLAAVSVRPAPRGGRRTGPRARFGRAENGRVAADGGRVAVPAHESTGPRHLRSAGRSGAPSDYETHRAVHRTRAEGSLMDLTTRYLGLELAHPFMPGASPLADDFDTVRRLEDAGAAAIVLPSLFEEEILAHASLADRYLEHVAKMRRSVDVPVIASLNGTLPERWLHYAKLIERAGAHALELNFYHVATDPCANASMVEHRLIDIVA